MKISKIVFGAIVAVATTIQAQENTVLMTIGGQEISRDEFEYIYNKNNANNAVDKKTLEEYLDLFENFKLKVIEAQNRGFDTLPAFLNELRGYRSQLAQPYLTDMSMEEKLCKEAYEHLLQDVEVSHILIKLPQNAMPSDTLEAYNKALKACERLAKEDFGKVADEMSDDPSVKQNHGYLGYFTGGMLVYPFEEAMYNMEIGKVSQPIRTFYGYHVIKVLNRRPAVGQVHVAHIMKMVPQDASDDDKLKAHDDIVKVLERLKNGDDFALVAREMSDDRGTASRGGELSWFGVGRMVREFETAAFALANAGDITEPVQSQFGWHIIKLIDKRGVESYEVRKPDILRQMQRDERSLMGRTALVERLKKEYNYTLKNGTKNIDAYVAKYPNADSLYFEHIDELTDTFAVFADVVLLEKDAALMFGLKTAENMPLAADFTTKVKDYVEEQVLAYEDTQLEAKYPEFRYLVQEYHDGILLFDISNNEVWERAAKDTEGLEKYFVENRANYNWDMPRYKGVIIRAKDVATAKAVKKMAQKLQADSLRSYVANRINTDSVTLVRIETGLWKQGDNAVVDKLAFKNKNASVVVDEQFPIVQVVGKQLKKGPEVYTDVRGIVTADYQNELERRWIEELRSKYEVVVNDEVLKTVK